MSEEKSGVSESSIAQLFTDHVLGKNKPYELKLLTDQKIDSLSDDELLLELLNHKVMSKIHNAQFKRINSIYKIRQSPKKEKKPRGRPSTKKEWDELMPILDALVTKKKQEKKNQETKLSDAAIIEHFCKGVKNNTGFDLTKNAKSLHNKLMAWRKKQG